MLVTSNVQFDSKTLEDIPGFISAEVIPGSSIVSVEINSKNISDLDKINDNFFKVLNQTGLIADSSYKIKIKVVDPLFTNPKPFYPQPIKFALYTLIGVYLLGVVLVYTFSE